MADPRNPGKHPNPEPRLAILETPPPTHSVRRGQISAVLRLLVFGVVIGGAWWWLHHRSGGDPRGWLEAVRATHPSVFIALMATLPVIGFPIAVCYLYAGAAFGFWWGWLYCLAGLSLSMSLGYWAARSFLRVPLQSLLAATCRRLPMPGERHHLRTLLFIRIVPGVPFALQNALLALLGIPFRKYLVVSLTAQGLQAALMCAIGGIGQKPYWLTAVLIAAAATGIFLLAHFGIRHNWGQKPQQPLPVSPPDIASSAGNVSPAIGSLPDAAPPSDSAAPVGATPSAGAVQQSGTAIPADGSSASAESPPDSTPLAGDGNCCPPSLKTPPET